MTETTYAVSGMTCGHCVSAVTQELTKLPGVKEVAVSLERNEVTVHSTGPLALAEVRAAIDEAGYELS